MFRRGGFLRPLIVVAVVLNVAHSLLTALGQQLAQPRSDGLSLLDESLRKFSHSDGPRHGDVEVLASRFRHNSEFLIEQAGARGSGYYVLDVDNSRRATASAMGIDNKQYIVNAYLVGFMPYETANLWEPLLTLAQRKSYQYDHFQYWGRQDVWQSSAQAFVRTRGDCEDHALALADWLIGLGEDARVVVGSWRGSGHAWVVLIKNGREYLFEATQKTNLHAGRRLPLARLQTDYRPSYMFNRDTFWSNEGTPFTSDYTGKHWQAKSRYYMQSERS